MKRTDDEYSGFRVNNPDGVSPIGGNDGKVSFGNDNPKDIREDSLGKVREVSSVRETSFGQQNSETPGTSEERATMTDKIRSTLSSSVTTSVNAGGLAAKAGIRRKPSTSVRTTRRTLCITTRK